MKKLWEPLDPSQGKFPTVGSKEPQLNDLIRDLNAWRTSALERQPVHLQDQLIKQKELLPIPEYLLKSGSRVEDSLGNMKKKKQLHLLTEEFHKFWSDVLEPKSKEIEQEKQRARQSAMEHELPNLTTFAGTTEDRPNNLEIAKLQITCILSRFGFPPDEQRSILLEMADAIPDTTNTDVDLPEIDIEEFNFFVDGMRNDDAHLPYRSAAKRSSSLLPALARTAAEGLLEIAGGAGGGRSSRKRATVAANADDEPVYRSFRR